MLHNGAPHDDDAQGTSATTTSAVWGGRAADGQQGAATSTVRGGAEGSRGPDKCHAIELWPAPARRVLAQPPAHTAQQGAGFCRRVAGRSPCDRRSHEPIIPGGGPPKANRSPNDWLCGSTPRPPRAALGTSWGHAHIAPKSCAHKPGNVYPIFRGRKIGYTNRPPRMTPNMLHPIFLGGGSVLKRLFFRQFLAPISDKRDSCLSKKLAQKLARNSGVQPGRSGHMMSLARDGRATHEA